jgi:(p)ppGpp synthase/HD superfamily hydrolase
MTPTFRFSDRRNRLVCFVKDAHATLTIDGLPQLRKYTDDPYHIHPIEVANLYNQYVCDDLGIEIALCHDLVEDTLVTPTWLGQVLEAFGYEELEAAEIVSGVVDLTDVYTKENHPDLNRRKRKKAEAERLSNISFRSQSIKYCDNICNGDSIEANDPDFAKVYFMEMRENLKTMNKGDERLYNRICGLVGSFFAKQQTA